MSFYSRATAATVVLSLPLSLIVLLPSCRSTPSPAPNSAPSRATTQVLESDWITLIDGESGLENFDRVGQANWHGEGGAIVADQGTAGFLVSKRSFRDVQIRAEFWADDATNSGVFARCSDRSSITFDNCYEINIYDKRPDPTYGTGAVVSVAKVNAASKAGGRWNVYEITVKGMHIHVELNGVQTADVDDMKLKEGPMALQYMNTLDGGVGGAIKWKSVRARSL